MPENYNTHGVSGLHIMIVHCEELVSRLIQESATAKPVRQFFPEGDDPPLKIESYAEPGASQSKHLC